MPYAHTIDESTESLVCDYCTEQITLDMEDVSCEKCKSHKIRFCGRECRDRAFTEYHQWECADIFHLLHQLRFHNVLLAVRVLVKLPLQDLFNQEHSLLRLTSDEMLVTIDQVQIWTALSTKIVESLEVSGFFEQDTWSQIDAKSTSTADRKLACSNFLLKLIHRLSRNCQGVWEYQDLFSANSNTDSRLISALSAHNWHKACAIYPTAVLLNHACLPNINMVFLPRARVQLWAVRKIKAGEEIFHDYGFKFGHMGREERQKECVENYYFECSCECCTGVDYALIERERDALNCPKCGGKIYSEEQYKCDVCVISQATWADQLKSEMKQWKEELLVTLRNPKQLPCVTGQKIIDKFQYFEKQVPELNHEVNELREGALKVVLQFEEPLSDEHRLWLSTCGRCHLSCTKRQYAPHSRRTAQAMLLLARVYNTVDNTQLHFVTMAAAFRIYYCHFGAELTQKLFDRCSQ